MTVLQFKEQLRRAFNINPTAAELGALVQYFDTTGDGSVDTIQFMLHFTKLNRIERAKVHRRRIAAERNVANKSKLEEESRVQKKQREDNQKLAFVQVDEVSVLRKVREVAQNFAVDSASYVEPMQAFKGPAMFPVAFREVFRRIFGIKLTYPEIGVLLTIYDVGGNGTIDGSLFVNSIFRLGMSCS